jgi:hypothetical protein
LGPTIDGLRLGAGRRRFGRGLLYLFGGEVRTFGFWFDCWMIFFGVLIFWIDGFVLMVVVIGVCDLQIGTLLRYGCCFAVMVDY